MMAYRTLVSADELAGRVGDSDWVVVDCRFSLDDTDRGERDYRAAHVPGAVYAHLDRDLSAPVVPGVTGRHPLPEPDDLVRRLGAWGIGPGVQVVAYDDSGGAIAARLWWMLRWLGHDDVAVLDGGWPRWAEGDRPTRNGQETRLPRSFTPLLRPEIVVDTDSVREWLLDADHLLCDSRSLDRYRGENETIDPVAGHIPGAVSVPYADNLDAEGFFLSVEKLRARFAGVLGDRSAEGVAFYCGSGVTAAHNLVALAHAGLGDAPLYAGSWSEWITDPSRPVAKGPGEATDDHGGS